MFKEFAFCPHAATVRVSYTIVRRVSDYLLDIINKGIFGTEKEFIFGTKKLHLNAVYMNFRLQLLKVL